MQDATGVKITSNITFPFDWSCGNLVIPDKNDDSYVGDDTGNTMFLHLC